MRNQKKIDKLKKTYNPPKEYYYVFFGSLIGAGIGAYVSSILKNDLYIVLFIIIGIVLSKMLGISLFKNFSVKQMKNTKFKISFFLGIGSLILAYLGFMGFIKSGEISYLSGFIFFGFSGLFLIFYKGSF